MHLQANATIENSFFPVGLFRLPYQLFQFPAPDDVRPILLITIPFLVSFNKPFRKRTPYFLYFTHNSYWRLGVSYLLTTGKHYIPQECRRECPIYPDRLVPIGECNLVFSHCILPEDRAICSPRELIASSVSCSFSMTSFGGSVLAI